MREILEYTKFQMVKAKSGTAIKNVKIFLCLLGIVFVIGSANRIIAQNAADEAAQEEIKDKQEQIEDLQKKAETYRNMIEMQQSKEQTLENQINLMEIQIKAFENDIVELQKEIDETAQEIGTKKDQIGEKETNIKEQKKILGELIQAYYEDDQDTLMEIILRNKNFSEFLGHTEYISQTSAKVDEILAAINDAKNQLESEKKELERINDEQREKRGQMNEKKVYLDSEQSSKEQLLVQTQGEEQKYQELLSRVEQQKQELLGDIGALSEEKSSELAAVEATLKRPKSGLASTKWYFSQRDSRWGNQHIGFSNSLMKNYGCAVTAVAMVLRHHGVSIDPGKLAKAPIFYHDLIVWPQQWQGVELASSTGHGNISWDTIDKELKKDNPVIVFVKATRRGAGHYVVIHGKDKNGDYVVHDPYWGANIYLDSTRALVSALYNSGTNIDQMIIYHK